MSMYLFFDTETTGVPRDYKAPVTDLDNWPRLVQLAWLVTDDQGAEFLGSVHKIRPDGFTIPETASKVHGISTERAMQEGIPLTLVLPAILADLQEASVLVAHNIAFDEKILGAELLRAGLSNPIETKPRQCTMHGSTDYCQLPGPYGYKWPKLSELHFALFGTPVEGAHDALVDVRACARCYFELRRLGVMAEPIQAHTEAVPA